MSLDLNAAYQLALQRNETLQMTSQEIRAAEARYWQAVSAVLPHIGLRATERLSNAPLTTGGRKDGFLGEVRGSWLVFDGFRQYNLAGAEAAQKRGLTQELIRARQLLYLDVGDMYLQIIGLEKDLEVLQNLLSALNRRKGELVDRISIGRSRKSELLSTETDIAATQSEMASVRGLQGASRELFAFLIGVPASHYTLTKPPGGLPQADDLFAYLWKSGARADLQAAAEYETARQRVVSADKGAFWPSIGVEAGWTAVESPSSNEDWSVVVSAELPIFDGGFRASQLAESKANLRISQLNLTRARRLADYEVRLAYNNFISAADQYLKLSVAERTAAENHGSQQKDYELGRASNLDVLLSLTNWQQLRRQLLAADIRARSNLIALEVAAGGGGEK